MDKIEVLNGIIGENIEWFWNNDSIVSYETNMSKLWDAFKVWCVQNCLEIFNDLDESVVEKTIEENYSNWISKQIF